jgi:hypothetical protein
MKNLFKPCCDLCSYLLTILSIVLFSSSIILLTYSISKDFSNNKRNRKSVETYNHTTSYEVNDSEKNFTLALSTDSQKTDTSKEVYLSKNKAIKLLQEK